MDTYTAPAPAPSAPLSDADGRYLKLAIKWSFTAREGNNRPFGAVIVSGDGKVLAEAYNQITETGDCTAHAETTAIRMVSPRHSREELARATMYASGEPCVMCAGAIFLSNIRRVVFGIDADSLRVWRSPRPDQRDAELSCRQVFAASPHPIECIGPAMQQEAMMAHQGFWKS